jgi:hypothetical protein
VIEINENPDTYFERSLAADLRRRASGAGLTVGELTARADLNRRTFERWSTGETTLGLRRYLALLRVVLRAEKMHERAERRFQERKPTATAGRPPSDRPAVRSVPPAASASGDDDVG